MPELSLAPIPPTDFDRWQNELIEGYALEHTRAGTWDASHALAAAREEFARLLPQGAGTPGHTIRFLNDPQTGHDVGTVWLFVSPDQSGGQRRGLFVYWVGVDAPFRGKGYGRAAMELIEREARHAGVGSIALHVFAENKVALELYRSCGFEETSFSMRKLLGAPGKESKDSAPPGSPSP
ncbi:MAG: GNAT family N-acetyltransferase [Thermoplasmata archaeon]|nr:GNAT family N-acetyltransferase [Thermoplasmata archaeon]